MEDAEIADVAQIERASGGKLSSALIAAVLVVLIGAGNVATGLIPQNEGKTNVAIIPVPGDIPTICYGETHGIRLGDHRDDKECKVLLRTRVVQIFIQLVVLIEVPADVERWAAFIDFVYNEGIGTFKKSSILRDLNAGRGDEACDDLTKYVYAGGRRLPGLVRRRQAERALCLQ